jgi:catechol 2,3-dioxygenase-like lactoylglutathione lyase family enzyme
MTQKPLSLCQVALCSSSPSGSLRLFTEAFGFSNAGSSAAWGDVLAMQSLPEETHAIIWWMVGNQPFFQLEIFHHGYPEQRPLPADWRPCDHGWVRFGIEVADFDRVETHLAKRGVPVLGRSGEAPSRRLAFREPYTGCVIEVIERPGLEGPAVAYATSSVADIGKARAFYCDVVGAELRSLDELHSLKDESLWGLPGIEREGFLACLPGGGVLEIVQYSSPEGRPRRADHRSSDQGFLNVAVGSRDIDEVRALIGRVHASGMPTTNVVDNGMICGTYIIEAGFEMEMLSIPPELDAATGFAKSPVPFVNEIGNP